MSALWILTAVCGCLLQASTQSPQTSAQSSTQSLQASAQSSQTSAQSSQTSAQSSQALAGAEALTDEQERPFTPEATQFVKGMVLLLLPQTYTDDDDWGQQKKIQSGLNVDLDGLKVKTSRRWKDVNHGTWQRVDATLVDPQEHLDLKIVILPKQERGISRYRITAGVRIRATARQQQWSYGAKLYSVSADAVADIRVVAELQFRSQLIKTAQDSKLRVLPFFETLNARLDTFSLRRVSHAKGALVREFGRAVKGLLQRSIERKNAKLAQKTNSRIQKKPERFEVPVGILGVFGATTEAESD